MTNPAATSVPRTRGARGVRVLAARSISAIVARKYVFSLCGEREESGDERKEWWWGVGSGEGVRRVNKMGKRNDNVWRTHFSFTSGALGFVWWSIAAHYCLRSLANLAL